MKISEQQSGYNANTRAQWENFENHRRHTTQTICDAKKLLPLTGAELSIAILGAGNGNDLDLETIANTYSKIHLFDFDPIALEYLESTQLGSASLAEAIVIEPPVDLSGISNVLDNLPPKLSESWILELADKTRIAKNVLPDRQFDVVVSTCLTTQLLSSIVNSLGDDSPYKNFMMLAIRDGHLKLLDNLICPGGAGVLVTDFVSSDTLPELATANTAESVLATARKAIDERNFFTGANPWAIKDALARLIVEDSFCPWSIAPPWRWQIGAERFYLVTAISFSKPLQPMP